MYSIQYSESITQLLNTLSLKSTGSTIIIVTKKVQQFNREQFDCKQFNCIT